MRSYTELEKTVASFSSCHPTNRDVEKGRATEVAVSLSPMTCEERLGQLCLISWVKRRSYNSPQGLEGKLQEDKPFLVAPDNTWGLKKPCKFLLRRLGLAIGKSFFFFLRKWCSTERNTQRGHKSRCALVLRVSAPSCSLGCRAQNNPSHSHSLVAFWGRETATLLQLGPRAPLCLGAGDALTFGDFSVVLVLVQAQDAGAEAAVRLAQQAEHVGLPGRVQPRKELLVLPVRQRAARDGGHRRSNGGRGQGQHTYGTNTGVGWAVLGRDKRVETKEQLAGWPAPVCWCRVLGQMLQMLA